MYEDEILVKRIDSLSELKELSEGAPLFCSGDTQNTYCLISIDGKTTCGIAYCDYGIKPVTTLADNGSILYIGFGETVVAIEISSGQCINQELLQSVFYDFIVDPSKSIVCAMCELNSYGFKQGKAVWRQGFWDIVTEFNLKNDKEISVKCMDGSQVMLSFADGAMRI